MNNNNNDNEMTIEESHKDCFVCHTFKGVVNGKAVWKCGKHQVLFYRD